MTAPINMAISKAVDLIRCGYAPEDATMMAMSGWSWSSSERERIEAGVSERDPRPRAAWEQK
jgi:hypothetical protein